MNTFDLNTIQTKEEEQFSNIGLKCSKHNTKKQYITNQFRLKFKLEENANRLV